MGKRKLLDCEGGARSLVIFITVVLGYVHGQSHSHYYSNHFRTGYQGNGYPASYKTYPVPQEQQFQPQVQSSQPEIEPPFHSFHRQSFHPVPAQSSQQQGFFQSIQPTQQQSFESVQPFQQQGFSPAQPSQQQRFIEPAQPFQFSPAQPPQQQQFIEPAQPPQQQQFIEPAQPPQQQQFIEPAQPSQQQQFIEPAQPSQQQRFIEPAQPFQFSPAQPSQQQAFIEPVQPFSQQGFSPAPAQPSQQQQFIDSAQPSQQQGFNSAQPFQYEGFEQIQPAQQQVFNQVQRVQPVQQQQGFASSGQIVPQSTPSANRANTNRNTNQRRGRPQNRRPATTGTGTRTRGNIADDLQAQFQEIFNWNVDLANDTRFQNCVVPDIGDVSRACPKRAFYFGLNPSHRRAVGMVKSILTQPQNPEQTVCLAGAMRDLPGMNPNVWIRGMLGAHLSDVGLFDLRVPPMVEVMPHIFLTNDILRQAKEQGALGSAQRRCLVIDGSSGRDNGVENILWYFREDVQVNSFHLNWHLVYPFTGITRRADRSGELFYFTHRMHLNRYHAERLSNGLGPVAPLDIDYNVPIPEGFNPHLDDTNSGMSWGPRRPNSILQDAVFINITGVPPNISVSDRVLHVRRVQEAINNRAVRLPNGGSLSLNNFDAMDILGHIVEASVFSPNSEYYGTFGFHNEGHVLISLIENPQNRTTLPPGVMLEVATAMRDPAFYTYHTSMNNVFDLEKQTERPYQSVGGDFPLEWDGIEVTRVQVVSDAAAQGAPNVLTTFMNQRTFELSRGLDFNRSGIQGSVPACVNHLDHIGFSYQIDVNRRRDVSTDRATVRIFLAPRFDEFGRRYSIREQRNWFFMLDLFTINLNRFGSSRIVRHSSESSLTIDIPQSGSDPTMDLGQMQYCGCGWPRHMLLPRGNERGGMVFDLFVMITNGWEDFVAPTRSTTTQNECSPAPIYCGRLNDTYPDARPMGYPFDRLPLNNLRNLDDYTRLASNMAYTQITIQHNPSPPSGSQRQPPTQPQTPGSGSGDAGVTRDYYFNPNTQTFERPIPGVVPTRRTPVQFQEDRTGRTQNVGAGNRDAGVTRDFYFNPDTQTFERPVPGVVPTRRTPVQFQEDRSPAFSFPQFFRGSGTFGQRQQK